MALNPARMASSKVLASFRAVFVVFVLHEGDPAVEEILLDFLKACHPSFDLCFPAGCHSDVAALNLYIHTCPPA